MRLQAGESGQTESAIAGSDRRVRFAVEVKPEGDGAEFEIAILDGEAVVALHRARIQLR